MTTGAQQRPQEIPDGLCCCIDPTAHTSHYHIITCLVLYGTKSLLECRLHQWQGTGECRASVTTEEGQQLLPGKNTWSCSTVKKDCQHRCRTHWK